MQHEWIGVPSQLSNNEEDALSHQASYKGDIAGKPIELCNIYAALRKLGLLRRQQVGASVERVGPLAVFKLDELCADPSSR
jgi:hypothetical protein